MSELVDGAEGGPDPALAEWLGDVAAAVDDDLRRAAVPWDFAAVLARVHALDPSCVSAEAVREAGLAEPVVSLAQRRARRSTRDDAEFERLIGDVRAANEHDAALRMHGVAPRSAPPLSGLGRRVGLAVLALAAALVLAFGVVEGVRYVRVPGGAPADAALHQGEAVNTPAEQTVVEQGPSPAARVRPTATAEVPNAVELPNAAEVPQAAAPERAAAKPRKPKPVAAPAQPSLTERLAVLDGEAHAAWKAGDLAGAQAKFTALIELAGSSRLADLAYGDLFTLARRRNDTAQEVALWRRYLAAFPAGRFADDARAGLCRRDADDRTACWRAYLDDFPQGSYRAQAEREGGGAP